MISIVKKALAIGILSFTKPIYHGRISPLPSYSVMTPNGRWEVIHTNDGLVDRLNPPVIVTIKPNGFSINKAIFGSFQLEPLRSHARSGVYVSMSMYNIRWLKKIYLLEPLGFDRIALFEANRTTFYVLRRLDQSGCGT